MQRAAGPRSGPRSRRGHDSRHIRDVLWVPAWALARIDMHARRRMTNASEFVLQSKRDGARSRPLLPGHQALDLDGGVLGAGHAAAHDLDGLVARLLAGDIDLFRIDVGAEARVCGNGRRCRNGRSTNCIVPRNCNLTCAPCTGSKPRMSLTSPKNGTPCSCVVVGLVVAVAGQRRDCEHDGPSAARRCARQRPTVRSWCCSGSGSAQEEAAEQIHEHDHHGEGDGPADPDRRLASSWSTAAPAGSPPAPQDEVAEPAEPVHGRAVGGARPAGAASPSPPSADDR